MKVTEGSSWKVKPFEQEGSDIPCNLLNFLAFSSTLSSSLEALYIIPVSLFSTENGISGESSDCVQAIHKSLLFCWVRGSFGERPFTFSTFSDNCGHKDKSYQH